MQIKDPFLGDTASVALPGLDAGLVLIFLGWRVAVFSETQALTHSWASSDTPVINKCVLSTYYVPNSMLGTRNTEGHRSTWSLAVRIGLVSPIRKSFLKEARRCKNA